MALVLLAALLAQAAPARNEPRPTAQQLYDSCTAYLRDIARLSPERSMPASECETASLTVALTIRGSATGLDPGGRYCPPREPASQGSRPEAEAYLAFVDRYPQAKEHPDGLLVFVNAMLRQLPCPR